MFPENLVQACFEQVRYSYNKTIQQITMTYDGYVRQGSKIKTIVSVHHVITVIRIYNKHEVWKCTKTEHNLNYVSV